MNRGISTHSQKFYESQLKAKDIPTSNLITSLNSLQEIAKSKLTSIDTQVIIRNQISSQITYKQAKKLQNLQTKIKQNQQILRVVQICNKIDLKLQIYIACSESLQSKLQQFQNMYIMINELQSEFINLANQINRTNSNNKNTQISQLNGLKIQYFKQLQQKLLKYLIKNYYTPQRISNLINILTQFHLPLKAPTKSSTQPNYGSLDSKGDHSEGSFLIVQALLHEYCYYCLMHKIEIVVDVDSEDSDWQSVFFGIMWQKVTKSVKYIFLTPGGDEQCAYQIQEPNWMFQYLQRTFEVNYQFLTEKILQTVSHALQEPLKKYILTYNLSSFLYPAIQARLNIDLTQILSSESIPKCPQTTKTRNSFLIFNFLDQLHQLCQKLSQSFNHEVNFIQIMLMENQKYHPSIDILLRSFDYQHQWIEQRIFNDFSNINYSNLKDLKNIQAYNICVNFAHIFQKLYSKYRKIEHENIKNKINQFYYEKILHLVRHLVTSFQRVYNYTGIDRFQTLLSYRKVQTQFKAQFEAFIAQSPIFETTINQEYYSHMDKYNVLFALEELTPIHKKLYKLLADCNDQFTQVLLQNHEISNNKIKWNQIFEVWQQKLEQISKLTPKYKDEKIRSIFFVFVESMEFSQDGLQYFLSFFQPFLIVLFSIEETKIMKMLLEMEKGALNQYIKLHQNSLWFLTGNELRSIKKSAIKQPK